MRSIASSILASALFSFGIGFAAKAEWDFFSLEQHTTNSGDLNIYQFDSSAGTYQYLTTGDNLWSGMSWDETFYDPIDNELWIYNHVGIFDVYDLDTDTWTNDVAAGTNNISGANGFYLNNNSNVRTSITTNQTNITSNDADISTNATNITANTTAITSNDSDISTNATNITANTTAITSNDADISTNATNITANTTAITSNDSDISTNATNITANTTAITSNDADISTNATNITANTTAITSNDSDISTNATNITANTTAITSNDSDISTNASAITTNQTNITSNDSDISTNQTNITANTTSITSNDSDISTNATNITANTTSITTNESGIAVLQAMLKPKEGSTSTTRIGDETQNTLEIGGDTNPTTIDQEGISVGGSNLIKKTSTGDIHIGRHSFVIGNDVVNGAHPIWAEDDNGSKIPLNISGSDLQINGVSVQGQINTNKTNINNLGEGVANSTALTAALTALPQVSTESKLTCGVGTGAYSSSYALGVGCASKVNEKVNVNFGGSYVGGGSKDYGSGSLDSVAAKAGFVFKFGKIEKPTSISMKEKKALQSEVADLKAQNIALISRLEKLEQIALGFTKSTDLASISKK